MLNLVSTLISLAYLSIAVVAFQGENQIRTKIMERYNKSIPPYYISEGKNDARSDIHFGIVFRRIHQFSVERSTLTIDGYFYRGWYDERLSWKSASTFEYFGIDENRLWNPKITTFNSVKKEESSSEEPDFVMSVGMVYHTEMTRFHTYCKPNLKYFPFDTHVCEFIQGTWISHDNPFNTQSQIENDESTLNHFLTRNTKWEITSIRAKRKNYYPFPANKEIVIPAKITKMLFKRTTPLIALSILTVGILSILLGFLPLLLSPDNGLSIRLIFVTSGLLVLQQTAEVINVFAAAHQGEIPVINQYIVACIAFLLFSLLETITVNVLVRSTSKPSERIASIVTWSLSKSVFSVFGVQDSESGDGHLLIEDNVENATDIEEQPQPPPTMINVKWEDVTVFMDSAAFFILFLMWLVFAITVIFAH